jgi:flagellar motor switch/type III secretory pathway protein FliN/pSer/pThr/pTyr-binding forkhead associated (FHA) protein
MNQSRLQTSMPLGVLPAYSSEEVRLWNWFCRSFPQVEDWRRWLSDIFSQVLARRVGQELTIIQSHRFQPGIAEYKFTPPEIRLGRGTENHLPLSGTSISKNHARLFLQGDRHLIEDLGSVLGTYLNGKKLAPHQPTEVASGDQIVVFPYVFTAKIEAIWAPESNVQLHAGTVTPSSWSEFLKNTPDGFDAFLVTAHPTNQCAGLQIDRTFVHSILDRALTPKGVPSSASARAPSDTGVLSLLLLGILQNANRQLAFPFQFALNPMRSGSSELPQGRGQTVLVSVRLSDVSGSFRIFVPYSFFATMMDAVSAHPEIHLPNTITWSFQISAGMLALTTEEVRQLEPGDVVMFDSNPQMLFPGNFKKGWNIFFDQGNFSTARLDNSFEEIVMGVRVTDKETPGEGLNLEDLPVFLHVIVAQKELTLSEANNLVPGTILDLNRDLSNVVQLAVNGKIVGQGELVEVDGKLGVRIGKWGA